MKTNNLDVQLLELGDPAVLAVEYEMCRELLVKTASGDFKIKYYYIEELTDGDIYPRIKTLNKIELDKLPGIYHDAVRVKLDKWFVFENIQQPDRHP